MKYLLLVLFALVGFTQDSGHDADGHLKTEHQIPAGHSCMQRQVYDENAKRLAARGRQQAASLHPCDCSYSCRVDANGTVMETGGEKSTGCLSFCSKDGRKCGCHPEPACEIEPHSARFDMNHQMTAMATRTPRSYEATR